MRKYAYLKEPIDNGSGERCSKIMVYESLEGVYLFYYTSIDSVFCCADEMYSDIEEVYRLFDKYVDARGWIDIGDPLPDCQHDAFLPIRVKGRAEGKPQWGSYEILDGGVWRNYKKNR